MQPGPIIIPPPPAVGVELDPLAGVPPPLDDIPTKPPSVDSLRAFFDGGTLALLGGCGCVNAGDIICGLGTGCRFCIDGWPCVIGFIAGYRRSYATS